MFEGFERIDIDTSGARIHLRHGGKGPPLLLLHGNPMTHVMWHKIADRLARAFHVVAADLRGYGDSSAPDAGENNINFSFRAMAQDQVEVMETLGYREFRVAGHDRGARTTHRMCLDHPQRILKAALIDILPNYHIWNNTSRQWAQSSWHWLFMAQPSPFPETMMGAVPARWFMEKKLSKPGLGLGFFDPRAFDEYVRCFNEKTIRGSCADYRACVTCDLEMDTADREAGRKVENPLLVLWGAKSHTGRVYKDVLKIWRDYGTDVTGAPIDCGHYVPEEKPDETYDHLIKFFR
ncbi:MAG: alpha/beta hydrolase [Alphaproteobacteria bacterium]|nr:alpha/beta hydrolase [Alphaproteobacteria bacterium]